MKFHVLTLFPKMIQDGLSSSIMGRAQEKHLIEINAVNIRDYTLDKHGKVDDYTYGGGAGMLMQAQPVYDAWKAVCGEKKLRTVYMTPQGVPFDQKLAEDLAMEEEVVFLCGHYEGIDERVLEEIATDYVSIGDYVLTGGELPAMVMMDAISRLVPDVLNNEGSAETESFQNHLLEYPQYSRPEVWHGKEVPEVLLSGDHKKIESWRLEASIKRTKAIRPDLYEKYEYDQQLIKMLLKHKKENIYLINSLKNGSAEVVKTCERGVLAYQKRSKTWMLCASEEKEAKELADALPNEAECLLHNCRELVDYISEKKGFKLYEECDQMVHTGRESLRVPHKDIRTLTVEEISYVKERYPGETILENFEPGMAYSEIYGAFLEDRPVGICSLKKDGSVGNLFVAEEYRRRGIGSSLAAFTMNKSMEKGDIPYAYSDVCEEAPVKMLQKMGLYLSKQRIYRMGK